MTILIWYSFINNIVSSSIGIAITELLTLIWIYSIILDIFRTIVLSWAKTVSWRSVKNGIARSIERIISQDIINIDWCIRPSWLAYLRNSLNIVWIRVKSCQIWTFIRRVSWIFACGRKRRRIWIGVIVICWEIGIWL